MNIKTVEVGGYIAALRGMRHPKESYRESDSIHLELDNFYCDFQDGTDWYLDYGLKEPLYIGENDKTLATKLSNVKGGSGHDCFLKGIVVWFDVAGSHVFWPQFERYHFADIVSSQSKMHCLVKGKIDDKCTDEVDKDTINKINHYIEVYNNWNDSGIEILSVNGKNGKIIIETQKDLFKYIANNLPLGYQLTATVVTNFLQLKTIYMQRKGHKMDYWHDFVDWIGTLPFAKQLIFNK